MQAKIWKAPLALVIRVQLYCRVNASALVPAAGKVGVPHFHRAQEGWEWSPHDEGVNISKSKHSEDRMTWSQWEEAAVDDH